MLKLWEGCQLCVHKDFCKGEFEANCVNNNYNKFFEIDTNPPKYDD